MSNRSKLTNTQQEELIQDYKNGLSFDQLGAKYLISKQTVSRILINHNIKQKGYHQKRWVNDHYFDIIDTEEKAYLLGFLIADGSVHEKNISTNKKYISHRIRFSNSEDDKEIIDIIHKQICPNNKVLYNHYTKGAKNRKPQYIIQWSAPNTVKVLKEQYNILPRKTFDPNFKFPFEKIPKILHRHFIRGFMDGDGSINYSELRFVFNSKLFMEQIIQNFKELFDEHADDVWDFSYSIKEVKGKTTTYWRLFIPLGHGRDKLIKSYLYKDATIFLNRKKNKAFTKKIRRHE